MNHRDVLYFFYEVINSERRTRTDVPLLSWFATTDDKHISQLVTQRLSLSSRLEYVPSILLFFVRPVP